MARSRSHREIRFGVTTGHRYSQRWRVGVAAGRPQFYVASQKTGSFVHISVEAPTYGMHVKITHPGGVAVHRYDHPPADGDGVTRFVEITIPLTALTEPEAAMKAVRWVAVEDVPDVWITFDVVVEEPGAPAGGSDWYRRVMLVGRVMRSDGRTVAVGVRPVRGAPGSFTFPGTITPEQRQAIREAAAEGNLRVLIHGRYDDGTVWLMDARAESADAKPEAD